MPSQPTVMSTDAVRPGSTAAWAAALRPRSLWVALSPVLVGMALAYAERGLIDLVAATLVVLAALLMQLITNAQNDLGFTARGGEAQGQRAGLPRASANGWLTPGQLRRAIVAMSLLATLLGLCLVAYRGWPVLWIGLASLLAALAYMGGPWPIAYTPLGELTVAVFFGLVAVNGCDWVLHGTVSLSSLLAALSMGSLTAAALALNNHRDRRHDAMLGRRTFVVCFGESASRRLYAFLLFSPFAWTALLALSLRTPWPLLVALLVPKTYRLWRDFAACQDPWQLNALLFRTFTLSFWFALLLALALTMPRWLGMMPLFGS